MVLSFAASHVEFILFFQCGFQKSHFIYEFNVALFVLLIIIYQNYHNTCVIFYFLLKFTSFFCPKCNKLQLLLFDFTWSIFSHLYYRKKTRKYFSQLVRTKSRLGVKSGYFLSPYSDHRVNDQRLMYF